VKIICATDAIARERSRFLRHQIRHNGRIRDVFPRLGAGTPWTAAAFTVARPAECIGPSVAAFGIGGSVTGTRADLLVCDDVVDVRSLHSKAERRRVADYFANNLMNLLEPDGRFWGLFTPWHHDDLNARLKKNGAYALFSRAVGADFEPVWPERWPAEALRARKEEIGSASFSRGYRLQSVADDDTPIRASWIRFWSAGVSPAAAGTGEPHGYDEVILAVDPAVSTEARADRSALVVLGRDLSPPPPPPPGEGEKERAPLPPPASDRDPEWRSVGCGFEPGRGVGGRGEIHVLAARAARISTPELVNLIDAYDRQWNPLVILFESNAAFQGLRELLARTTPFGPKLKAVTQTTDKAARVAALSVPVENGALRLMGNAAGDGPDESQRELWEEMAGFPYADTDDLVDAAATGCSYLLTRKEPMIW
jgi:phage terminase large subunit-like protein